MPDEKEEKLIEEVHKELKGEPRITTIHGTDPDKITVDPATGLQNDYVILAPEERAKGFVRPVRRTYVHVGPPGPKFPLRDLTEDEKTDYGDYGYVKFEVYPADYQKNATGRFWSQKDLDKVGKGCGSSTTMGQALAETYARNPSFYGATYCCACQDHLPVGADGEFVWEHTNERVGT